MYQIIMVIYIYRPTIHQFKRRQIQFTMETTHDIVFKEFLKIERPLFIINYIYVSQYIYKYIVSLPGESVPSWSTF